MQAMRYDMGRTVLDVAEVMERSSYLKGMSDTTDRQRIRAVMNGGAKGVQAVLNSAAMSSSLPSGFGVDLPTANIMYSSLERLAQRIGRQPTIKTDMIPTKDTNPARKKAEKRARIVSAWDENDSMELQYPQIGRWLPGYGFTLHVIRDRWFGDTTYPVAELRDPYDVYPGTFGANQQPTECAVYRSMSPRSIMRIYPHHAGQMQSMMDMKEAAIRSSQTTFGAAAGQWEKGLATSGASEDMTVVEYMCDSGTYVVCLDMGMLLSYIPNPLYSGPAFVVTKRFAFDKLQGQFHHVFGLMAMMAKLNILGLIGVEDSTFRETNIIGEMVGNTYKRGRFAINEFEHGTEIEKPTSDQLQQTWQAINILERQFRIVAGYDVAQDGQSPNSFATGQGIKELGSSADQNVREYQTSIKYTVELLDRKRLEWEEVMHGEEKKNVFWFEGAKHSEETYVASKDIAGDYRTKRIFGAMATFDENSKIIAGLQMLQARVMDRRTLQENLDGLENVSLINERIDQDQAKEMLLQSLGARAAQGDPTADMALVEILDNPSAAVDTLKKLFTPQEPQMSPEEQMMAAGQGPPGMPGMPPGGPGGPPGGPGGQESLEGGPPPAVQTILAQMESQGGGAMSVGRM